MALEMRSASRLLAVVGVLVVVLSGCGKGSATPLIPLQDAAAKAGSPTAAPRDSSPPSTSASHTTRPPTVPSSTSTTLPVTTTAPADPLAACQAAFIEVETSPATPPDQSPYQVCDHHDFFQITLQEANRNAPGYSFPLYGGVYISANCATLRAQGPEPKACVGVDPPDAQNTPLGPPPTSP
jgi:hypothetical protein